MQKRGRVLRDTNAGPGLLTVDGIHYTFVLEGMWRSEVPPRPGMPVDVSFATDGALETVVAVSEGQVAQEQAKKAISGAVRHSQTLKGELMKTSLVNRFGIATLGAELVMLISFFALPNLLVGSVYARTSLTGWDVTGFSPNTMSGSDHGFISLLGIVCLFAPVAVPFLRRGWARWLNSAPLAFVVVAAIAVFREIQNLTQGASHEIANSLGSEAAKELSRQASSLFTVSVGAYLVLLCTIFLLSRALKAPGSSRE